MIEIGWIKLGFKYFFIPEYEWGPDGHCQQIDKHLHLVAGNDPLKNKKYLAICILQEFWVKDWWKGKKKI